jgi:hypothetical protein
MCRAILIFLFGIGFGSGIYGQSDPEDLRKAIGYYQQLKFEESIALFDQLVDENPGDFNMQGRRGYVIAEFVKAMDGGLVAAKTRDEIKLLVEKGLADLRAGLEKEPNNKDNQAALRFLESR